MSVVIAHRDELIAAGIRRALEHHGISVPEVAGSAHQAASLVIRHRPAVCLVDGRIGLSHVAFDEVRALTPPVKLAVLAESASERMVMRAVLDGADGYLLRAIPPDRLSAALQAVARGEAALPRTFTSRLVSEVRRSPHRSPAKRFGGTVAYPFRFVRHYRRRRRMEMSVGEAIASTRRRMRSYAGLAR